MSEQKIEAVDVELENEDLDFDDSDFGFIISRDGELKHLMLPEDLMEDPPEEVKRILKIFGIKDIHTFEDRTLH